MFPVILNAGPVTIKSFGVLLCIAFLACLFVVWKRTREEGLPEESVLDMFFLSTGAFILFGRLGFVFSNWQIFQEDIGRIILLFRYPGISFEWGLIFASLVIFGLSRLFTLSALLIFDIVFLGLTLASAFWFLGCFLDGCYSNPSVSLGMTVSYLALYFILRLAISRIKKSPDLHILSKKPGFIALCYLIFTSVSFLICSYVLRLPLPKIAILVLVLSTGSFLFRYFEFLKGVQWSSFPKAFYHKSVDTLRKGKGLLKRKFLT